MKVKFAQSISTLNDGSFAGGSTHNVRDDLAFAWVKSGVCIALEPIPEKAPEVVPATPPESKVVSEEKSKTTAAPSKPTSQSKSRR